MVWNTGSLDPGVRLDSLIREDNGQELLVDAEARKWIVDLTVLRPGSLQTVISPSDVMRSVTVSGLVGLAFKLVVRSQATCRRG
jgi:hypothetical protein